MSLLHRFSSLFNEYANRLISSHLFLLVHIAFITFWLVLKLDITLLALVLSVEGVTIWTVVLKSTNKIREGQEKKDRFENKRFREFLEEDIKSTEQNLKVSREIFLKLQENEYRLEELKSQVEELSKSVSVTIPGQNSESRSE
ncbi:MAG: hypothetical protein M1352_00055 [Patescibacteria group bacterium]|nr:hypothetical protein [Patescibacteria group bacterium]